MLKLSSPANPCSLLAVGRALVAWALFSVVAPGIIAMGAGVNVEKVLP